MKKEKIEERLSTMRVILFILISCIFSLIGISLPKTINFINGLEEISFYGYFASYSISMLLFWLFTKNYNFKTSRKSVFTELYKKLKRVLEEIK